MGVLRFVLCSFFVAATCGSAHAQDAMVERASGGAPVGAFQFLSKGETFALAAAQVVQIGYLKSCTSEVITGGTVRIGTDQSSVTGGDVQRETIACDLNLSLSQAERNESGASAWRNDASGEVAIIANLSPVLVFDTAPSSVKIERTDIPGRTIRLSMNANAIDLDARGVVLEAGGIYTVTAGGQRREIEVDFDAVDAGGPAFLRAVRF